jgi:hypothetical protein
MNIGRIIRVIIKVAPVIVDAVRGAKKKPERQPVPGVYGD